MVTLRSLAKEYNKLQKIYGARELDAIVGGGCTKHPHICFIFMNPTGRNIASSKEWTGIKAPWIGTKNIWDLFYQLHLLDGDIYKRIKDIRGKDWTYDFASQVYLDVTKHKCYITNLGKCTQVDARPLADATLRQYLNLLEQEIDIVKPQIVILFGNQVSSIFLNEKISVSKCRRQVYYKTIGDHVYPCYPVYYPVGNGRFNLDKAIQDITWIMENNLYVGK